MTKRTEQSSKAEAAPEQVPVVKLSRSVHSLTFTPDCSEVLQPLRTVEHSLTNDTDHGCQIAAKPQPLAAKVTTDFAGRETAVASMATPAGLEPAVKHLLADTGYTVEGGAPVPPWPAPHTRGLQAFKDVDTGMLDLVQHQPQGLIRYGSRVNRAELIAQVAAAWPDASIVVAVARRREVYSFRDRLRRYFDDVLTLTASRPEPAASSRVVVGTYATLGSGAVGIERRDLYFAANATESSGAKGLKGLFRAWGAKFFGFVPADDQLAVLDEDSLRCLYGFEEVNIPYHGYHNLPVSVALVPFTGQPNVPADATVFDVKRFGVWRHSERNRRIASLAGQLASGNVEGLAQHVPTVGRAVRSDGPLRVTILVENREHASELKYLLSDWNVIAGLGPGMPRQSSATRKALVKRCPQLLHPDRKIFTESEAKDIDLEQVDVLIRGDADTGLPSIPNGNWVFENPISHRLLLVDFTDRHHPFLRRQSRKRREAYAAHGWFTAGTNPAEERVKLFLASRPKVFHV